jgi:phenylalanyl-tRNA synthetase alpha subunit
VAVDDLPGPVVTFLNVIGVEWPYINEDSVMQFASLVRQFAQAVESTHQDATTAIQGIAQGYQGASTQQLSSGWQELSARHVTELVDGCAVLADALEVAAGYIVAQKVAAIAELIAMAATFVADQAAAVATFGIAEAAVPAIIAAGKKLMESLVQDLEQYIIGQVVEAAAKPLFAKVAEAMEGLDWSKTTPASAESTGFSLDDQLVRTHTDALRQHAQTFRSHAITFQRGIQELSF